MACRFELLAVTYFPLGELSIFSFAFSRSTACLQGRVEECNMRHGVL